MATVLRAVIYLISLLVCLAIVVLLLVITYEEPAPGMGCRVLGSQIVRAQNGLRMECVENAETGHLYWRVMKERQ